MPEPFFPEVTAAWSKAAIANGEIPANEFMEAAQKFIPIFDRLGKVFFPVKGDMNGNVEKLVKHLAATPAASLEAMIKAEKAAGKSKDKNSAASSLLWLKRAMQFIFALLKRVSKGEEANKAAQEAYKETLMQYHGFMVKKTFQMGLMAAPSTASMLACLGSNDAQSMSEMQAWVAVAEPMLDSIHKFLETEGLDDKSTV